MLSASAWIVLLRPFFTLLVAAVVLLPARLAARRYLPEGRVKRLLLLELGPGKRRARR